MRSNFQHVIEAMAALEQHARAAIDAHLGAQFADSPGLHDHVRRVAHLSTSVALLRGIREPEVSTIEWAALLHHCCGSPASCTCEGPDSGAPRPAGPCRNGLAFVARVPGFAAALEYVEQFHRLRTAPAGSARAKPAFPVRVLAICDRFDELTTRASSPLTPEAALLTLIERVSPDDAGILQALCDLRGASMPRRPPQATRGASERPRLASPLWSGIAPPFDAGAASV